MDNNSIPLQSSTAFGSAAIILTSGQMDFIAVAIPEINPPPPTGIIIASSSPEICDPISRPIVPWPRVVLKWIVSLKI